MTVKLMTADPYRPAYHFAARKGWLNDPNGLIQWKDQYHLFYQYHPHSTKWGPMHWGHAVSDDLMGWTHLPIALAPPKAATPGDQTGIFSGSAADDNGVLTLFYTLHTDTEAHPGATREVQCIATSTDGVTFEKYSGNPIISSPPPEATTGFRDPKVWKDEDGRWKMLIGSGHNGKGRALLYQSQDLRDWTYVGPLCEGDGSNGEMWECPDLFRLGDKHVLLFSVNEPPLKPMTYYFVGTYAGNRFTPEVFGEVDFGPDFYAAQTFEDKQGRRLVIGWMARWGAKTPTEAYGWTGVMSLPRELFLLPNGRLGVRPVAEVEGIRSTSLGHWQGVGIRPEGENLLAGLEGDSLEIQLTLDLTRSSATEFGLHVHRSDDGGQQTTLSYNLKSGELTLDRSASGLGEGGQYGHLLETQDRTELLLRLFVDRCSVELFAGEGEAVGSAKVYPKQGEGLGLALYAKEGEVSLKSLRVWELKVENP